MDQNILNVIFDDYIRAFPLLNDEIHSEYFKWQAAQEFAAFDFSDPTDFVSRLKALEKTASVVIDNKTIYPFSTLCTCAAMSEENAETVRKMFLDLFAEDNGDLFARQDRIDDFVAASDDLRMKCDKKGYAFANSQTSVMGYLALRNPEQDYLLSSTKAKKLAECVGFEDDWGTLSSFSLTVYYRFCDQLVEAMKQYPPLLETAAKRAAVAKYAPKDPILPLHPDTNLHLLAFDLIHFYSFPEYHVGGKGISEKDWYTNYPKALKARASFLAAEENYNLVQEYLLAYETAASVGAEVVHTTYGKGTVTETHSAPTGAWMMVSFPESGKTLPVTLEQLMKGTPMALRGEVDVNEEGRALYARKTIVNLVYKQSKKEMEPYLWYFE